MEKKMGKTKKYAETVGSIKTMSNKHTKEGLWRHFVTMTKSLLSYESFAA